MLALGEEQHLDWVFPARLVGLLAHPGIFALGAGLGHGLIPGEPIALGVIHAADEDVAAAVALDVAFDEGKAPFRTEVPRA